MGSASALKGMKRASTYSAARGAQLAYVQAAGVEMAPQGIQINAIAQNFVDNPTYFPEETKANPAFQTDLNVKCRWAGWYPWTKMRSLLPICVPMRQTVLSVRCFR
jgi:NAD(P)-dependent dehydrogenase (short-subunit alcohol dehydrogenase family)